MIVAPFGPLALASPFAGDEKLVVPDFDIDVFTLQSWDVGLDDQLVARLVHLDFWPEIGSAQTRPPSVFRQAPAERARAEEVVEEPIHVLVEAPQQRERP